MVLGGCENPTASAYSLADQSYVDRSYTKIGASAQSGGWGPVVDPVLCHMPFNVGAVARKPEAVA